MMYEAFTGPDMDSAVHVRTEVEVDDVAIRMVHNTKTFKYGAGSYVSSKEVKDDVTEALAGLMEDVQEHYSSLCSYTETSERMGNSSSCWPESGHINWPSSRTKSRSFSRRCVLVLVLFLAAVLGCSLSHYWCREDDPHEQLMDKRVYRRRAPSSPTRRRRRGWSSIVPR